MAPLRDNRFAGADLTDVLLEEAWSVQRTVKLSGGDVTLVAIQEGYGWKASIVSPALFDRLEFHALFPKGALDTAEAFVRRRFAEDARSWGHRR